ncbi:MAG TPA: hypothetical protein VD948_06840 [Rhodothermales bacterium]|nr:hypothetical protein [Rhodothermales bacterium]
MRSSLLLLAAVAAFPAGAQTVRVAPPPPPTPAVAPAPAVAARAGQEDPWCRERGATRQTNRAEVCEVREYTLPAREEVEVDAGLNGGIKVTGYDGRSIRLRARVVAQAATAARATQLMRNVRIETEDTIEPENALPTERNASISVSFELMVPRRTNLSLTTLNGGISITNVTGDIAFEATNGGISLNGLGGDVEGETVNGGVSVDLAGSRWTGAGLEVSTVNGSIRLAMPAEYSAELEASTMHGRLDINLPGSGVASGSQRTISYGRSHSGAAAPRYQEVKMRLGRGGAPIELTTVNGAVSIIRK